MFIAYMTIIVPLFISLIFTLICYYKSFQTLLDESWHTPTRASMKSTIRDLCMYSFVHLGMMGITLTYAMIYSFVELDNQIVNTITTFPMLLTGFANTSIYCAQKSRNSKSLNCSRIVYGESDFTSRTSLVEEPGY